MMRPDGREIDEIRPLAFELAPIVYPEGSVLIKQGNTWVLCAVTVQEEVPHWRKGSGDGWLTAEYAMLPRSTRSRVSRSHVQGGRAKEISRLIGRSLRRAVALDQIGERTLIVDCDVLQADGGTRTASVTGGYVAVALALHKLIQDNVLPASALQQPVAAISAGVVEGEARLDLSYAEDSRAEVDLNLVMDAAGRLVEVQGTAEGEPVPRRVLNRLLDLAAQGIESVIREQREALRCAGITI